MSNLLWLVFILSFILGEFIPFLWLKKYTVRKMQNLIKESPEGEISTPE